MSDLESQATVLNKVIEDTKNEKESALTELEKDNPSPRIPWYYYLGIGFVAGGVGVHFLLK